MLPNGPFRPQWVKAGTSAFCEWQNSEDDNLSIYVEQFPSDTHSCFGFLNSMKNQSLPPQQQHTLWLCLPNPEQKSTKKV